MKVSLHDLFCEFMNWNWTLFLINWVNFNWDPVTFVLSLSRLSSGQTNYIAGPLFSLGNCTLLISLLDLRPAYVDFVLFNLLFYFFVVYDLLCI